MTIEQGENHGLVTAYLLDGAGGGRTLSWNEINAWSPDQGVIWVHLDYTSEGAGRWLRDHSGLDAMITQALLQEETRPRTAPTGSGLLVALRGVNMNPGADPEDMVSIRIWADATRIISTRHRRLLSVDDLRGRIDHGHGPRGPGEFLVHIADRLVARMADVVAGIDEAVDTLEDRVLSAESYQLRSELGVLRRQIIALRRYLAPQREATARLLQERADWLGEGHRLQLREVADRVTRYVEDLDAARERAMVTQEELGNRLAEQMNRRMYVLSIVAAVFLPLSFITGLLGVNLGGIPGAEDSWGFLLLCTALAGLFLMQWMFLRRRHWM